MGELFEKKRKNVLRLWLGLRIGLANMIAY